MTNPSRKVVAVVTMALTMCASTAAFATAAAEKVPPLPIPVDSVDKALAPDKLKAAADQSNDPDVLLGLLYLSRDIDPAFTEIAAKLAKTKAEYAPAAAVVRVIIANADDASIAELIARDGENALGHYLQAHALYTADKDKEALAAYQKATQCREMRLYDATTSAALFKALTALKLEGRDRACALSWVASRALNFGVSYMQALPSDVAEMARRSQADQREQISDQLLVIAGHLYTTNPDNRRYGDRALESAFRMKAELAAEQGSPKMNGYAAVTQALVSTMVPGPGQREARDAAQFLPSRVYGVLFRTNPPAGSPAPAKGPEFDAELKAGEALLNAVAADPDATVGAFLKGLIPPSKKVEKSPWVFRWSYVDKLMGDKPELFAVATEYEKAMRAAEQARHNDQPTRNMRQMMNVVIGAVGYAFDHGNTFPDSLQTLVDKKALDAKTSTKSMLSGRPYVFVAAGEKLPAKDKDRSGFIVLYDDEPVGKTYQCILADGHGEHIPVEKVKEQLRARGK